MDFSQSSWHLLLLLLNSFQCYFYFLLDLSHSFHKFYYYLYLSLFFDIYSYSKFSPIVCYEWWDLGWYINFAVDWKLCHNKLLKQVLLLFQLLVYCQDCKKWIYFLILIFIFFLIYFHFSIFRTLGLGLEWWLVTPSHQSHLMVWSQQWSWNTKERSRRF